RRLQQIAGLAKEIPGSRHPQSLHDGNINPPSEGPARKERREQARDCPFPGLLRAQVRRQLVPADGPSHKVGGSVPNPHNNQSKEQQPRPHALDPVKPDGEAQRERKEQQRARADSHRGQAFHQRPPRPEGQRGNSQNKDKEKIYRRGRKSTQARRSRSRSGTPGARSRRQARSIRKGPAALPEQWPAKQPPWSSTNPAPPKSGSGRRPSPLASRSSVEPPLSQDWDRFMILAEGEEYAGKSQRRTRLSPSASLSPIPPCRRSRF